MLGEEGEAALSPQSAVGAVHFVCSLHDINKGKIDILVITCH